ncbi:MAG: hypothetical protein A2W00_01135 [Candidatus Eisenbacteria bacterium RBG_16_71_46]|nr:MAG: hypothetical protein A2W00_01135 [Candidatus Eisenbacteria bacterium RBG_16_71_46]OGF25923.1 MAG: hypothetical protein A2V63_01220 [Candidatus Eisenbacteria bacterium RBG_19FT_COMBO_70_11]
MNTKITTPLIGALLALALASTAFAAPVNGTYTSTDLGGQLLTGRASTWRSGINSGLPHVLHAQSWTGTTLGTQWEISCPKEPVNFVVQDNRVGGVGTIVYTSTFNGGTFTFFPGGWPWGDGTGTLGTTTLITTVQYILIGGVSTPVAAVVNGNTSGLFVGGCNLTFAIANGVGVGETTSLNPAIMKPADYPTFLDGSCGPAPANAQFGSWGTVITITMNIDCATPTHESTWGRVKQLYR